MSVRVYGAVPPRVKHELEPSTRVVKGCSGKGIFTSPGNLKVVALCGVAKGESKVGCLSLGGKEGREEKNGTQ